MNDSSILASRLREVILNGTWIANTNFKDQLRELDWKLANKRVGTSNSIALLARHIHYYIAGIKNVFAGGTLDIKDQYSFDFQEIQSPVEWQTFLHQFWQDAETLANFIEEFPPARLNEYFVHEKYGSYMRNIDAMIEHSYYHLGQVVLLKKLLTSDK